ncbi:hypothetical protein B9Z55_016137 [Caenorhabditis nigoni]|uniref:Methyltransferase FkbM domain-containing protein n=1 Tax=Caenorhabditis nigoni TaxID=1611254 RepID=A0A2G5UDF8_9PELO|nr:hypothetical protein B9Z55_016137 [Caenorhabditis nigoni]
MANQFVILAVVVIVTLVNFMMWSGTNYGSNVSSASRAGNPSLISFGNPFDNPSNRSLTEIENNMQEIKQKLESEMEILKALKAGQQGPGESFEAHFEKMKNFSTSQVDLRKRTLASIYKNEQYYLLYGALGPEVFCPEKVRVGTVGDGGKWVCNPWKTPKDSVMISLGLNNLITFEEEWQKITNNVNVLYGYDAAEQSEETKKTYAAIRGTPKKATISVGTDAARFKYTIEDLMKESNITNVEILKIDIEGAELTCLIPFLEKFQVCQIYLEVHGGAQEHADLLRQIAHLNYRIFSYEINGWAMGACEYSFIHESCVDKYGAMRIANFLDFKA